MSRRDRVLVGLALLGLTLAAYHGLWSAGFVYEDAAWMPLLTVAGPLDALRAWPWALAGLVGHGAPLAYHAVGLIAHLLNGYLFWRLLSKWSEPVAWVATSLYLLHPMQVESVAYITGGREVVAVTYVLLALTAGTAPLSAPWRVPLVILAMAGAVAVKSSASVVVLLVPYVLCVACEFEVAFAVIPFMLLVLASVLWVHAQHVMELAVGGSIQILGPDTFYNAGLTCAALVRYLLLVVMPAGFSVDHDWRGLPLALPIAATLCVAVIGGAGWLLFRRLPELLLAIGWIALALLPRFVIQQEDVLNEHQMFLPLLAVWVLIGIGLTEGYAALTQPGRLPTHA